jgi:protein-disulfide isomerase
MKEERIGQLFLAGIGLFGIIIIGGLTWALFAGPSARLTEQIAETDLRFSDTNDPSKGPADSKVNVRMFSDFQCPSCRSAEQGVRYAMEKYSENVRFIWNDFPLSSIHANAMMSANAARCAEEQGKFWEYHDMLYEKQPAWSVENNPLVTFVDYAKQLGLEEGGFSTCLSAQKYAQKIRDDVAEGTTNRVDATPTVFIGQKRFVGSLDPSVWDKEVAEALGQTGE